MVANICTISDCSKLEGKGLFGFIRTLLLITRALLVQHPLAQHWMTSQRCTDISQIMKNLQPFMITNTPVLQDSEEFYSVNKTSNWLYLYLHSLLYNHMNCYPYICPVFEPVLFLPRSRWILLHALKLMKTINSRISLILTKVEVNCVSYLYFSLF